MHNFITALILITFQFTLNAQVKVGSEIHLNQLNIKPITTSTVSKSKLIVLDFWATWCAPCIASFSHLDSLQKKYEEQVQIIALSDEPIQKVSNFLKTKTYSFDFFIDTDKTVFKLFQIESRPLTVLLNASGTLLWVGTSNDLETVLEQATKGKSFFEFNSQLNHFYSKYYNTSDNKSDYSIYTYKICITNNPDEYEAKTQKGNMVDSAINIYYKATPVSEIIQDLVSVSDIQFSNQRSELDTILLDITAKSISNQITYTKESVKLISDLTAIFNFRVVETYEQRDVYSLTVIDSNKLLLNMELIDGGGMVETKGEKISIHRLSLPELSGYFQKKLKTLVVFSGDNISKFNLEFDKFKTIEELNLQLKEKYGMVLLPTKSIVKFIELK